jgi:hypothetical protein
LVVDCAAAAYSRCCSFQTSRQWQKKEDRRLAQTRRDGCRSNFERSCSLRQKTPPPTTVRLLSIWTSIPLLGNSGRIAGLSKAGEGRSGTTGLGPVCRHQKRQAGHSRSVSLQERPARKQKMKPFEDCRYWRSPSWPTKARLSSWSFRWSFSRCFRSTNRVGGGGGRLVADESSIRSLHSPRAESFPEKEILPPIVTDLAPSSNATPLVPRELAPDEAALCCVRRAGNSQFGSISRGTGVLRRNARVAAVWRRSEIVTPLGEVAAPQLRSNGFAEWPAPYNRKDSMQLTRPTLSISQRKLFKRLLITYLAIGTGLSWQDFPMCAKPTTVAKPSP